MLPISLGVTHISWFSQFFYKVSLLGAMVSHTLGVFRKAVSSVIFWEYVLPCLLSINRWIKVIKQVGIFPSSYVFIHRLFSTSFNLKPSSEESLLTSYPRTPGQSWLNLAHGMLSLQGLFNIFWGGVGGVWSVGAQSPGVVQDILESK